MSIKDFFGLIGEAWNELIGGIKSVFNFIYTSEYGMTVIFWMIFVIYILSKFFQWLDKRENERYQKAREERFKKEEEES